MFRAADTPARGIFVRCKGDGLCRGIFTVAIATDCALLRYSFCCPPICFAFFCDFDHKLDYLRDHLERLNSQTAPDQRPYPLTEQLEVPLSDYALYRSSRRTLSIQTASLFYFIVGYVRHDDTRVYVSRSY